MPAPRHTQARQGGYTYIGLLLLVALIGLVSATSLRLGVTAQRRVAEQELLARGLTLSRALASYAQATPSGHSDQPRSLQDLLRDPRPSAGLVRHLRRVEVDPITGVAEWGVVWNAQHTGIVGFHSLSDQKSLGRELSTPLDEFNERPYYRDWVFTSALVEP